MKKLLLIISLLLALTSIARDRLYINDFTIKANEAKTVELILKNDTTYSAFQVDISLPNGLEIETEGGEYIIDPTSRMTSNHTISTYQQQNGSIRIFVTSQGVRTFTGNDGAIATISIKALSYYTGRKKVTLTGIVAVEEDGTKHILNDETAWVSAEGGLIGDLDGTGMVDVDDVNAMINLILFYNQYKDKYPGNADLDGNGMIDVDDVNALINIILGTN